MYHLYVCFSPQSDGGGLPASHRSELLPADASGTSPLCLFVEDAGDPSLDVREDFSALLAYHTVEAVAAEGSDTCTILGETDSYYNAGALLAHEHEVTSACTYNDIIWTLHMKTGDKITLRQVEECSEKQRRTVSWEDTPMDTTADLQALLDDLTLNLDAETELVVELPSVTYTEPLTIRRAMTLQAHADGTEFTAPITVNHMAYSEVTDIHVVLSGLRLCGAGDMTGTGVTAKAPTYLNNCWITNWDVGALAADGGWIWVEKSSFTRNATALRIDTTESSSWGSDLHGGNFIRNGTALDIQRMPGDWMTYYVHNSTFTDNDTVIAGPLADQVRLEDGNYVQQSA